LIGYPAAAAGLVGETGDRRPETEDRMRAMGKCRATFTVQEVVSAGLHRFLLGAQK
jgi:hypothetical protein